MNHVGTVTKSSRLPDLPFHAQCSCGTAGTFLEKEQAVQYLHNHGAQVTAHGNLTTFELVDNSETTEAEEAVVPVAGDAGETVDPSTQVSEEPETTWPKKKKK